MENFDLSTVTCEKLQLLLDTAKHEIAKYTRYRERIESCKENLEKQKPKNLFIFILLGFLLFSMMTMGRGMPIPFPFILFSVLIGAVLILILIFRQKKYQGKIKEYESQVSDLRKKAEEAMDEFKAALFIPNDYCYEYAVSTMLQYIINKRADSWKEVVALYEEHLHRMTMEEQSKLQTDIARETLSATQSAAAGAWASAAGIWFRR